MKTRNRKTITTQSVGVAESLTMRLGKISVDVIIRRYGRVDLDDKQTTRKSLLGGAKRLPGIDERDRLEKGVWEYGRDACGAHGKSASAERGQHGKAGGMSRICREE